MAAFNVITVYIKEIYNTELPSCANEFKIVCAALLLDVDLEFVPPFEFKRKTHWAGA